MKKVLTGNQAVAWGVMRCGAQVVSAYPDDEHAAIIDELARLVSKDLFDPEFVDAESGASALADCIGASLSGMRVFTAASSTGLMKMQEQLREAVLKQVPVVMAVNRNDCQSLSDVGWIQYTCETGQEALDTVIQAYKVAETLRLPVMLTMDALYLADTAEVVTIPDLDLTRSYLSRSRPVEKSNQIEAEMLAFSTEQDELFQSYVEINQTAKNAPKYCGEIDLEFGDLFGRSYGVIGKYPMEADCDLMIVTCGTMVATACEAVNRLRERGSRVGLSKVRLRHPFPDSELITELGRGVKVAVIDQEISVGIGGVLAQQIKAALYHLPEGQRPEIVEYIARAGTTVAEIESIAEDALRQRSGMGYCGRS